MGIYPETSWKRHEATNEAVYTYSVPGLTVTETYKLDSRIEERTDCFCCSCGDTPDDPYCRNHGYYGKRPCELHQMPGSPIEDTNEMPDSVQVERARRKEQTA